MPFDQLMIRRLSSRAPSQDGLIILVGVADAYIPPHLVLSLVVHGQVMVG